MNALASAIGAIADEGAVAAGPTALPTGSPASTAKSATAAPASAESTAASAPSATAENAAGRSTGARSAGKPGLSIRVRYGQTARRILHAENRPAQSEV